MAKASRIKVPKRVAGVKIPKTVRKGPVMQFVNSTAGRMLIAEALTAAVAVFAYQHRDSETGRKIKNGALDAEQALKRNTARLTAAFGEAVGAFRAALSQPIDGESGLDVDAVGNSVRDDAPKKRTRPSSSEPVSPG
jgi:hypothetical protein